MQRAGALAVGTLGDVLRRYAEALAAHREAINRLNVYPVPDGDTGTNMALTVESVVAALDAAGPVPAWTMAEACKAISHGALMGARGNSGLILSQVLRGLCQSLAPLPEAGPVEVARALALASQSARRAVSKPVEGTVLTVAQAAAAAAAQAAQQGATLVGVLDAVRDAAADALEHTPEQLPQLAAAGVVDAGGAGLVLLFDAFLAVLDGRPLPEPPEVPTVALAPSQGGSGEADEGGGELRYEVMYILEAPEQSIPAFREVWEGVGESIVVVGEDGLWNCHIHTDDVGAAVEAALDAGRPRNIRVTDLREEVEEERWVREAAAQGGDDAGAPREPPLTAVVAVGNGDGIRRIFRSLGVHQIVRGGQSMNPPTAAILSAVEAAPAGSVLILPNNPNIVPVAEQVVRLSPKCVRVLPTHGIVEGFSALMGYDPQAGVEENLETMSAAAAHVVTGEVTQAVRDADSPAGRIERGEWLGLTGGRIEVVAQERAEAACALLAKLCTSDHELVTLIEGQGATAADTRRITEWLAEHHPRLQVEVHHGGQPLYPYLIGVE